MMFYIKFYKEIIELWEAEFMASDPIKKMYLMNIANDVLILNQKLVNY